VVLKWVSEMGEVRWRYSRWKTSWIS